MNNEFESFQRGIKYPWRPCKFCGRVLGEHLDPAGMSYCTSRHGIRKDCEYCIEATSVNEGQRIISNYTKEENLTDDY